MAASLQPWYRMSLPPLEPGQVCVSGVQRSADFVLGEAVVAIKVKALQVPVGVVRHHVGEKIGQEQVLQRLVRVWAGDPQCPAARASFAAGRKARINLLTAGAVRAFIDALQGRNL